MTEESGMLRLFIGSFDSEKFWREEQLANLPFLNDKQADAIVSVMDEMQFTFCEGKEDTVITRFPINHYFKDYLSSCGYEFACNKEFVKDYDIDSRNENIFGLFNCQDTITRFKKLIPDGSVLSPYSVIPGIRNFCSRLNLSYTLPDQDTVSRVNSKIYSSEVSESILNCSHGHIVKSTSDLSNLGKRLLKKEGGFLIKDPYGVSGKGILAVNTIFLLNRISCFLEKQEQDGKQILLLVESILDKETDFSCQVNISEEGKIEIVSVHVNDISGYRHLRCRYADNSFIEYLEKEKYHEKIELVAKHLYKDKYVGPVCIDSMKLKDGTLRIVLEINARKSMTLFHHSVRKKFPSVRDSSMIQLNLSIKRKIGIEEFIDLLYDNRILFNPASNEGVLLLSGNALIVNNNRKEYPYRAAMFAIILASDHLRKESFYVQLKRLLNESEISVNE